LVSLVISVSAFTAINHPPEQDARKILKRTRALKIAKYVMFNGVPTLLSDVAKELGISNSGAHARLKRGKLQLAKSPTDIQ
jgi:hypothetical protein